MKYISIVMLLLSLWACNSSEVDSCIDHTSGFDENCGCPGNQIAFGPLLPSGVRHCTNFGEFDLVYYFAEVNFQCFQDSVALGIDVLNGTIHPTLIPVVGSPFLSERGTTDYRREGWTKSLLAECPVTLETTYINFDDNSDVIDALPETLTFKLEHRASSNLTLEVIDSSEVTFFKDATRL